MHGYVADPYTLDMALTTGFEELWVNSSYGFEANYTVVNASGFINIRTGMFSDVVLQSGYSPQANLFGGYGGSITVEAGMTIGRFGPYQGAVDRTDWDIVYPDYSMTFINRGTILGDVRLNLGHDLYDGSAAAIGGIVYGNAGDDTLIGSGSADHLDGGFGADTLRAGGGSDLLTGGGGADSFVGTAAQLSGDTITDFSVGDRILLAGTLLGDFSAALLDSTLTYTGGSLTLQGLDPTARIVATSEDGVGVQLMLAGETTRDDFNGDQRDDLLFRHANGTTFEWLGQPYHIGFASNHANAQWLDPSWDALATGDFNGDGRSDMLLRHPNGIIFDQLGTDSGALSSNYSNAVYLDPSWQTVGTADFDGDGRDDLLLRHSSGMVMNLLGSADGAMVNNYANANWLDPSWQMVAAGDFNGDGRDDVLMKHANGTIFYWLGQESGGFVQNYGNAAWLDPSWSIAAVGDFNGDGRDDLLMRNSSGIIFDWLDPSWELGVNQSKGRALGGVMRA